MKPTKVTSLRAVAPDLTLAKPVLYSSRPAAGFPSPGDDQVEKPLDLNELLIENPTATFFVRVTGDSMEGAKIFDGDVLVVDRSIEPRAELIVVAAVFGELVVKRLRKTNSGLALISEQAGYEPIIVSDADDVFIWGIVVGSARVLA